MKRVAPPSGMPPPDSARLPDGTVVAILPLAERITEGHLARHPDEVKTYGWEMAWAWGVHDIQHLLAWAIEDADFAGQLHWLARVLDARGYPVANLLDGVRLAADWLAAELPAPHGETAAGRMRDAADALDGGQGREDRDQSART
jgi:hypothetical protein